MSLVSTARCRRIGVRQARTINSANLWCLKSPLSDRSVVLSGDMQMLLFYYCEGDPVVFAAEYGQIELVRSPGTPPAVANATVTLKDGSLQARVLIDGTEQASVNLQALRQNCGDSVLAVTAKELASFAMRIRNWQSAISACHRCNAGDLATVVETVERFVRMRRRTTIGATLRSTPTAHPALVLGAVALALRSRAFLSDLDNNPWCAHTRLMRSDDGSDG